LLARLARKGICAEIGLASRGFVMRTASIALAITAAALLSACSTVGTVAGVAGTVISTTVSVAGDVIGTAAHTATAAASVATENRDKLEDVVTPH